MTDETRETLTKIVRHAEMIIEHYPSVIVVPNIGIGTKELAALRDVLTSRNTCGTCRHDGHCGIQAVCVSSQFTDKRATGCIGAWEPREGEGGGK